MKSPKSTKQKWEEFAPTWTVMVPAPNPDKRWWQFWKPKFIAAPDPNPPKGKYIRKGKKVFISLDYQAK